MTHEAHVVPLRLRRRRRDGKSQEKKGCPQENVCFHLHRPRNPGDLCSLSEGWGFQAPFRTPSIEKTRPENCTICAMGSGISRVREGARFHGERLFRAVGPGFNESVLLFRILVPTPLFYGRN